ncbi:MAG TPA: IMP cyclohydrolase [Spirochaetales bacterium]|nr:IMP cyclohydrolase [Spirochaetales bacterium]
MAGKLTEQYKTLRTDHFPPRMEISFLHEDGKRSVLLYEKVCWNLDGEVKGLRYGENPDQEAALYRLINGNLVLGEVETIKPGRYLCSHIELLQSGKHPGKINITDVDSALNILRYFSKTPCAAIIKHNNPSGVARGETLSSAFEKAFKADRLAAFGGAVALNRTVDRETAEQITEQYFEVVAAPEYEEGVLALFQQKKNLRVLRIQNIKNLEQYVGTIFLDFKSLLDGGLIVQSSFNPVTLSPEDFLPAEVEYKGKLYRVEREPTREEYTDMLFGWLVETGITSNSVIYVKNGVTIGIGTGEQDRVGVAEIARDKAYRKLLDRLAWDQYGKLFAELKESDAQEELKQTVRSRKGDLPGSVMVSDGFFPFRDGIEVGLREGVTAVVQPGGSLRDFESIEACNEYKATMKFTGQRCFRH